MIMRKRDKTLERISLLVNGCEKWLEGLQNNNGIYTFENFEVELSNGRSGTIFDFWRKGKKDQESARYISNGSAFVFYTSNKRIALEDSGGLCIEEHTNEDSAYSHFEFRWTGGDLEGVPKGTLMFARVDFSGSSFVSYRYGYRTNDYEIDRAGDENLSKLGLPEDLRKVSKILGMPFEKKINFDKKKEEILKRSGLEKLSQEYTV